MASQKPCSAKGERYDMLRTFAIDLAFLSRIFDGSVCVIILFKIIFNEG